MASARRPPRSRRSHRPQPTAGPAGLARIQAQLGLWPLRLLWLGAPAGVGYGLSGAIGRFEPSGALLVEVLLWAAWFAGLVATLVPSPLSLTGLRILAPGAVALAGMAAVATGDRSPEILAAAGYGALAGVACFGPVVGDRMVNGSAYGSERRMALRPPAFALLGPVPVAWLAVFAGAVAGPWLLAGGRYLAGTAATAVGALAGWLGFRALHQLSRRWVVFVPAGLVIHDHVLLAESILLRRATITSLGPATTPLPAAAVDLSGGARGLALLAVLGEPARFGLRHRRQVTDTSAEALVFSPCLPGAVLVEARIRAIRG